MRGMGRIITTPIVVLSVILVSFIAIIALFEYYHLRTRQLIDENSEALALLTSWDALQNSTKDLLIADDLNAARRRWTTTIDTFDKKINHFVQSGIIRNLSTRKSDFGNKIKETENLWQVIKPRIENVQLRFGEYLAQEGVTNPVQRRSLLHELLFQMGQRDRSMDYMVLFDLTYDIQYMVSSLNEYFVSILNDTVKMIIAAIEHETLNVRVGVILTALVIVAFTISFVIYSQKALETTTDQLKYLSNQLLQAEEKERKRIAYELHDEVGQSLTAIKFCVESALHRVSEGSVQQSVALLEDLVGLIKNSISEARKISVSLRPAMIDQLGIIATISWFCREFQKVYSGITISKHINVEEKNVPDTLKIVVYRVLQESLTNIAKHSQASKVTVSLARYKKSIKLIIKDNGIGMKEEALKFKTRGGGGLGLITMRERIQLSDGNFTIRSGTDEGTTVTASWVA